MLAKKKIYKFTLLKLICCKTNFNYQNYTQSFIYQVQFDEIEGRLTWYLSHPIIPKQENCGG